MYGHGQYNNDKKGAAISRYTNRKIVLAIFQVQILRPPISTIIVFHCFVFCQCAQILTIINLPCSDCEVYTTKASDYRLKWKTV